MLSVPVHIAVPALLVRETDGSTSGTIVITAVSAMMFAQDVAVFIATMTYEPARVCGPKSRDEPVPAIALVVIPVPRMCSW